MTHVVRWAIIAALLAAAAVMNGCGAANDLPRQAGQADQPITDVGADAAAVPDGLADSSPIPVLAYYYIWFTPQSWDRAKTDLPQLGAYSSDDEAVMRQHIRWAKEAGIDGFIVSWKSTEPLNRRLRLLMRVADEQQFKLAIIYQGLDFERHPLPADRVAADLDEFFRDFASDPAFDLFQRPMIIWSGTWEFSRDDIARVTAGRRSHALILASERNLEGYNRLADVVDGNAYYWSSVDPNTFPGYRKKLSELSEAVHHHGGLWIAPAAPGFDARLIGGTRVVDRKDGETLRQELGAALSSAPDAVGLISWNEFSENSHVEPSRNYGRRYLDVLAEAAHSPPDVATFESDSPGAARPTTDGPLIAGALGLVMLGCVGVLVARGLRRR
jgi:hypothetical protein